MKLVAHVGPNGKLKPPAATKAAVSARPSGVAAKAARAQAVQAAKQKAIAQARPAPAAAPAGVTPAQEAAQGRELLLGVRTVLEDLAKLAA